MCLRLWLLNVHRYYCYSYCQTPKCDNDDHGREMIMKTSLLFIITDTILIIIVVTILARQEEEAECDRHEFIAVSYTAPALALDEDENDDEDIDYSSAVVPTFEYCCHHHVADELISFLYSHLSFFYITRTL